MTAAILAPATTLDATGIADLAVTALRSEADLTPKPGLVDGRGPGAHSDMSLALLHDSAESLRDAFTECASTAMQSTPGPELRARLGEIGRAGERVMLRATGGVNTHRGALWALGLLGAGVAIAGSATGAIDVAARLAQLPDPALGAAAVATSNGARVRRRYGASGAAGEAQAGFPHVRLHALPALRAARRSGADEASARLAALLSLMAHLDDTCLLHRGGQVGLTAVQEGARAVLAAGGCRTPAGRHHFAALDALCAAHRLSPGGSGDLLATTLFLDALDERSAAPCKL
ncbi:triphosphoribosyl-dephospho-CoA synthase [Mycobacterium sp. URHB0044]|uniref:triphosphoribosyl-dephospho-CoA synthase n=1 Tax=Mycobacterium sp. URHB0044 TaxID=1380386 RepID=UPI0004919CD8|nr:triphosphoribosyl-dephospho-CoA synthase [Mycobacterium sp. URHB0044]